MRKKNRNKKVDKRLSMNRHHLKNRSQGGSSEDWNLILLDIERHQYWHRLFKNLDLDEVIALLLRLKRFKDYQKGGEQC